MSCSSSESNKLYQISRILSTNKLLRSNLFFFWFYFLKTTSRKPVSVDQRFGVSLSFVITNNRYEKLPDKLKECHSVKYIKRVPISFVSLIIVRTSLHFCVCTWLAWTTENYLLKRHVCKARLSAEFLFRKSIYSTILSN